MNRFFIGDRFATRQEVMQYEASYGDRFGIVIAVATVINVYTNLSFAHSERFRYFIMSKHGDNKAV
jgi:uncharacterized membrane protein YkvI